MNLGASRPGCHAAGARLERRVRHHATDTTAVPKRHTLTPLRTFWRRRRLHNRGGPRCLENRDALAQGLERVKWRDA
jgi:hypothetical protein